MSNIRPFQDNTSEKKNCRRNKKAGKADESIQRKNKEYGDVNSEVSEKKNQ